VHGMPVVRWVAAALAFGGLLFAWIRPNPTIDIYTLEGGEIIALRSMHTGQYLQLDEETGQVFANAETPAAQTAQWQVLVIDTDTVRILARSAQGVDARSERFTGRRMKTASGCACSGFSNAHGLGRFCHPWEDKNQEAWCYVSDNCTSAALKGSFGRRFESCDQPPSWGGDIDNSGPMTADPHRLVPTSGCNCSGSSNTHGFGASCKAWEYEGQTPWCYVDPTCAHERSAPYGRGNGSFGMPYEDCTPEQFSSSSLDGLRPFRRRLLAPPKIAPGQ
jgi:hypothetical protein